MVTAVSLSLANTYPRCVVDTYVSVRLFRKRLPTGGVVVTVDAYVFWVVGLARSSCPLVWLRRRMMLQL